MASLDFFAVSSFRDSPLGCRAPARAVTYVFSVATRPQARLRSHRAW